MNSRLLCIAVLLLAGPANAWAWNTDLNLNPRAEWIGSKRADQATRGLLIGRADLSDGALSLAVEGFVEAEAETDRARERRSERVAELQEAYVDYRMDAFFIRVGRQPVRWSQSWTLPSLDLFTERRWNRLFFDPIPEQLVHPDGILVTWAGAGASVDAFANLSPAVPRYPRPLPEGPARELDPEGGFRLQYKLGGLDTSWVYKRADEISTFGTSLSFATDLAVWKLEAGLTGAKDGFAAIGVDFFFGDLSILPQVTRFLDEVVTNDRNEHIGYLPIRYVAGRNSFDFQVYRNFDAFDTFGQVMYSRDITDVFKLSLFAQKYEGRPGRLFGLYQALTEGGTVAGVRLELNQAL